MSRANSTLLAQILPAGSANIFVLSACYTLFVCAISVDMTLTGITGYQLAPNKMLATLPFALITVSGALSTFFVSYFIERFGAALAFSVGAAVGGVGGLISTWAVIHFQFWLFCLGTSAVGIYQAFAQYYRLVAADSVDGARKGTAISIVLAGGILAAVIGPVLASWGRTLIPNSLFAGAYLVVAALGLTSMLIVTAFYRSSAIKIDRPQISTDLPSRSMKESLWQPAFVASIGNSVVGAVAMMFVMTAAPLAAVMCHYTIDDGATVIQWHLVGMYAPSLITGILITRFGLAKILYIGMILNVACVVVALLSASLMAFYVALFCLGVGWNFMFVGGTSLLTQSYRPSERARLQGVGETLRFTTMALAALVAGPFLQFYGWKSVNITILPLILVSAISTIWWVRSRNIKGV